MTIFTGNQTEIYVAIAIKHGLQLWSKHKIQPNRMYTPKRMMLQASKITGSKFKARDYSGAISALEIWLQNRRNENV